MQCCLLLVLALLGATSASPPAPARPEAEAAALALPEDDGDDGDDGGDARCPLASETRTLSVSDPLAATTYRYVVVNHCRTFHGAQAVCRRCYGGQLASVHSPRVNALLRCRARLCTNRGQVWIGAVTRPRVRDPREGTRDTAPAPPHPARPGHLPCHLSPVPTLGVPALSQCPQCAPWVSQPCPPPRRARCPHALAPLAGTHRELPLGRREPLELLVLVARVPAVLRLLLHRPLHQQRALEERALPREAALRLPVLRGSAPAVPCAPGTPAPPDLNKVSAVSAHLCAQALGGWGILGL
ncbi:uncharacterized protein LOC135579649 isoform X1 [Columba livia]|uniref:uncharacterized protein LOC135579649 isoform X1 n=1 Tax=Columba livia TaxID=8932 RepID=UPI0031B9FA97